MKTKQTRGFLFFKALLFRPAPLLCQLLLLCLTFPLWGEGPVFSGILDSSLALGVPAGDGRFFYGFEEYANLRLQQRLGDKAVFYAAFNCAAASGSAGAGFQPGENYASTLELERLFMRLRGEYLDLEAGLLRLAFGYGQVWGPSDFLNPRNPLIPDARPRAVLGGDLVWYPGDMSKLQIFAAAPRDSADTSGAASRFGLMAEYHGNSASLQALYAYESPDDRTRLGIHSGGLSFKLDLALGFVTEAFYTFDPEKGGSPEDLAASAGLDYSFGRGDWYILAEYLYRGEKAVNPWALENQHYLYSELRYRYSDYTAWSLGAVLALEDLSAIPQLRMETEFFQGVSLVLSCRVPLAPFQKDGELGPDKTGAHALIDAKIRLRL
ncbi:MAG: hypothetical protein LBH73_02105 [Spirochaetaceae bacterium]|jgi:hypothetical protein|nr:hypothetical protein [Spirochaetaceae bacterium]